MGHQGVAARMWAGLAPPDSCPLVATSACARWPRPRGSLPLGVCGAQQCPTVFALAARQPQARNACLLTLVPGGNEEYVAAKDLSLYVLAAAAPSAPFIP